MRNIVLGLAGLMLLSACGANHNTVFRQSVVSASEASIITVDAKQRMMLSAIVPVVQQAPGDTDETVTVQQQRFCAEPSPDVYSVMAQALSAGGTFGRNADPTTVQAAINAAFSSAEQGSTIPRTQTVNMLRELMYRTCERYLSGGYDGVELSVQAIRDQRLMVSILAIEQLTGAVTPRPVVISAAGSGGAGATGDAIVRLDEARKARDQAATTATSAEAAYEQVNGTDKVCDAIKDKPAAELTDAQKAKVEPCNRARETRANAQGARTRTTAAYEELSTLARTGGVSVAATTQANAPGGLDVAGRPGDVAAVSEVVRAIVSANMSDSSEIMIFCLRALRDRNDMGQAIVVPAGLRDTCIGFLQDSVVAASARLADEQRLVREMQQSRQGEQEAATREFARFWTPARATAMLQLDYRRRVVTRLKERLPSSEAGRADCFIDADTINEARECFARLDSPTQRDLRWQTEG